MGGINKVRFSCFVSLKKTSWGPGALHLIWSSGCCLIFTVGFFLRHWSFMSLKIFPSPVGNQKYSTQWTHWFRVRKLQPPNRFPTSITISNAIAGFVMLKYHELIGFFIKNFTRLSLKSENPEKIRISFIATFFHFMACLESPGHTLGCQYA